MLLRVALLLLMATAAAAQDHPLSGMVHNTKEASSLYFECRPAGGDGVECTFNQSSVRKKVKENELSELLSKARESFRKSPNEKLKPEECVAYEKVQLALRGGAADLTAEQRTWLQAMDLRERQDTLALFNAMIGFCKNPNEESAVALARLSHNRDSRSCKVMSHTFIQRFRRVQNSNTWTSNEGPNGPCGTVVVARLEKARDATFFWTYTTKKVVTNPKAEVLPGMSCTGLDEQEYFYDWRSKARFMGCDYIDFGP